MAFSPGTGVDLLAQHRVCATLRPGLDRARISLRVVGKAWSAHLYDDRLHSIDRLGGVGPSADAVRRPVHGAGDRRRTCGDSWQDRGAAGRQRALTVTTKAIAAQ